MFLSPHTHAYMSVCTCCLVTVFPSCTYSCSCIFSSLLNLIFMIRIVLILNASIHAVFVASRAHVMLQVRITLFFVLIVIPKHFHFVLAKVFLIFQPNLFRLYDIFSEIDICLLYRLCALPKLLYTGDKWGNLVTFVVRRESN